MLSLMVVLNLALVGAVTQDSCDGRIEMPLGLDYSDFALGKLYDARTATVSSVQLWKDTDIAKYTSEPVLEGTVPPEYTMSLKQYAQITREIPDEYTKVSRAVGLIPDNLYDIPKLGYSTYASREFVMQSVSLDSGVKRAPVLFSRASREIGQPTHVISSIKYGSRREVRVDQGIFGRTHVHYASQCPLQGKLRKGTFEIEKSEIESISFLEDDFSNGIGQCQGGVPIAVTLTPLLCYIPLAYYSSAGEGRSKLADQVVDAEQHNHELKRLSVQFEELQLQGYRDIIDGVLDVHTKFLEYYKGFVGDLVRLHRDFSLQDYLIDIEVSRYQRGALSVAVSNLTKFMSWVEELFQLRDDLKEHGSIMGSRREFSLHVPIVDALPDYKKDIEEAWTLLKSGIIVDYKDFGLGDLSRYMDRFVLRELLFTEDCKGQDCTVVPTETQFENLANAVLVYNDKIVETCSPPRTENYECVSPPTSPKPTTCEDVSCQGGTYCVEAHPFAMCVPQHTCGAFSKTIVVAGNGPQICDECPVGMMSDNIGNSTNCTPMESIDMMTSDTIRVYGKVLHEEPNGFIHYGKVTIPGLKEEVLYETKCPCYAKVPDLVCPMVDGAPVYSPLCHCSDAQNEFSVDDDVEWTFNSDLFDMYGDCIQEIDHTYQYVIAGVGAFVVISAVAVGAVVVVRKRKKAARASVDVRKNSQAVGAFSSDPQRSQTHFMDESNL